MLWKKRCRFETSFSHRKRQRLHFHEIIQIIQVAHRNSKQLNGAKSSSLPHSLLWYFLSDFWPTILRTNIFKGLLKIYFSLRNNVYLVSFLHVLFVWRLCRIENVFWESLTCHKCFPSRNSKFRASKNRFYCVFPSQNSCKKEVFYKRLFQGSDKINCIRTFIFILVKTNENKVVRGYF